MKISLVSETYFPQVNGVSRALGRLVDHLVECGDEVQLIVPRYAEENSADDKQEVERHSFPSLPMPFYPEIRIVLSSAGGVTEKLRAFQPDIVHIATEGTLGRSALKAVRKLQLPLTTSYHTNFPDYLVYYKCGFLENTAWNYLRKFHNKGKNTFCPSRSIKEILEKNGFDNVIVWGRGVESERFSPEKRSDVVRRKLGAGDNTKLLLYVGRLANEKNLQMLTDAFEALPESMDCKLVFVGDGPMKPKLEKQNNPDIVFTGYKRGEELAEIYASCDLFVFPSITETFGNVILEGMSAGLPAVGYDAPGPRDIIKDGVTGFVIPEVTAEAMTNAVMKAIGSPDALAKMRIEVRKHACSQTWNAINSVVRDTYLNCIN